MNILDILYTVLILPLQLTFEALYVITNNFIQNPGLSIVALSLMMNFLVLPLYMRADAMQEHERDMEARLRRGVAHIKKTFTGDERMMMTQTYYRQNGYRPTDVFKGSVSLFLEIPFFISAYLFLSNCQIIQGVPFGPISDLGSPDGLITIGNMSVNLLPFVMTGINLVSCALFTKGMPVKTKVQLYGMAAFFLVFLYGSPAGLVFYWTLNNLFALVKTIFYKLKNPKRVLKALFAVVGVALVCAGPLAYGGVSVKRTGLLVVLGVCCMLPAIATLLRGRIPAMPSFAQRERSRAAFVAGALFLTVMMGLLIPSAVMSASPQEFFDVQHYQNPVWQLVGSSCLAAGVFLVWFSVFYWLCNKKAKVIFEVGLWIACGVAVVDYMCFAGNLGLINATLQYENDPSFSSMDKVVNLAVLIVLGAAMALVALKFRKVPQTVLTVASVAIVAMSVLNVSAVFASVEDAQPSIQAAQAGKPTFQLSKTGKNVVVIMLDRGIGEITPFLMNENPKLIEQFDGFTDYRNVISFGKSTNFAASALFGGYEYTPEAMNRRDDVLLVDKHNEAMRLMPVLFDEQGYDVTVCNPTYAGYQWTPDVSIYGDHPDIRTFLTDGAFGASQKASTENNKRNFFCYSVMRSAPLFAWGALYGGGMYNCSNVQSSEEASVQVVSDDGLTAQGISKRFMGPYGLLQHMPEITTAVNDEKGAFVMLSNDTTHNPMLLQLPDYSVSAQVDNTDFQVNSMTADGETINMSDVRQREHFQSDMAAFMRLGEWFDYLRSQGVYDNTKIVIASDHGYFTDYSDQLEYADDEGNTVDPENIYPMLLVKDFNASGYSSSMEFMTNADVPSLAFAGVIANPVNPATGNVVTWDEKFAHPQHPFISDLYSTDDNNGTRFNPDGFWLAIQGNMREMGNWTTIEDPS